MNPRQLSIRTTSSAFSEPTYRAQSVAIFAAHAVQLTTAQKVVFDYGIDYWITSGDWAEMDVVWYPKLVTAQQGHINLKNPSAYTLTPMNFASTFVTKVGYPCVSANSTHLKTGWIPRTHGVKYTLNNASVFVKMKNNVTDDGLAIGVANNGVIFLRPAATFGDLTGYLNDSTSFSVSNSVGNGLFSAARTGVSAGTIKRDTTTLGTFTTTSDTVPDAEVFAGGYNNGGTAAGFINGNTVEGFGFGSASVNMANIKTVFDYWNTNL